MKSATTLSAAVALLSSTTNAFWRMPCHDSTALARLDPIVDTGKASSHGHTIHGGSNFGESTTYDDLRNSECTSCQFKEDKSAYWTPSLHFVGEDGKTEIVPQVGGMLAYYLLIGDNIKAFPKEFEMLAGDSRLRNFTGAVPDLPTSSWGPEDKTQLALGQKSLGFNCLNYNKAPEGSRYRHTLPTKEFMDENCANGIRAEIFFPSCWNGKDVDSPDHRSHVAYPDMVDGGTCPEGFETRLPSLFYETIWNTYAFKDKAGAFVWSNGDPTGCGYHADFLMGWDVDTLQSAVDTCTNLSGRVEDCPVFAGALQTEEEQGQCKIQEMPKALKNDNCDGPANGLCGNVPIQYGPEYANALKGGEAGGEPTVKPTLSSVASTSTQGYAPAKSEGAGGISVYNVEVKPAAVPKTSATPSPSSSSLSSSSSSKAAPTSSSAAPAVTPAAEYSAESGCDAIISTTSYTSAGTVYEVAIKEVCVTVTVDAAPKARRHAHAHRREHQHGVQARH